MRLPGVRGSSAIRRCGSGRDDPISPGKLNMNRYEKLVIIFPAVADAALFAYLFIAPLLSPLPFVIGRVCALAPPITGIVVLVALPILRHWAMIPKRSDSVPVGIVLALLGILEPYVFY